MAGSGSKENTPKKRPEPGSAKADPEAAAPKAESKAKSPADHPDFFATIVRRWKNRRTVQLILTYAASGYALIQFIAAALRNHPDLDSILSAAWTVYWIGFAVVLFAVPLVLQGTHRFRSGLVAGVVVTSLLAGMFLQTRIAPDGGGGSQLVQGDSTPATREGNILGNNGGRSSEPPVNREGDDSGNRVPVGNDDPGALQPPANDPQRENPTQQAESPVVTDNQTRTDSGTTSPQRSAYDQLLLLYGDRDMLTLNTRPGLVELFAGRAHPISVRYYQYSGNKARLNVTTERGESARVLELETVNAENDMQVRIQTTCGVLTYTLEVIRLLENAEVTIAIDEARSRAEVERAEQLGQCRGV